MPPANGGWSVLFLPAPSPGQVIRYLERQRRRDHDPVPDGLLLSDAVGPQRLRVLVGTADTRAWMEESAPRLASALSGPVILLYRAAEQWGFASCEPGGVAAVCGEFSRAPAASTRLTRFLASLRPLPSPEAAWARKRRLPCDRIPALSLRRLPLIDYATVARLDQKSLLVEDSPRLYRFDLPPLPPVVQMPQAV